MDVRAHNRAKNQKRGMNRGVRNIRRSVESSSYPVFWGIRERLLSEAAVVCEFKDISKLAVTIIGQSRYSNPYLAKGLPTEFIARRVESTTSPINRVALGGLAVYGANKLVVELKGDDIKTEQLKLEAAFELDGFPLKPPHRADMSFRPHVSIGRIIPGYRQYFDEGVLGRWERHVGLGDSSTPEINLDAVMIGGQPIESATHCGELVGGLL